MKCLTSVVLACAAITVWAEPPKPKLLTPEERAAHLAKVNELRMKRYGGYVVRPGSQRGEVCYVNCQKTAPKAWIDESIEYFRAQTKFNVTYSEGSFDFAAPKIKGNATLFVIEDPKLPAILVAPEDRWAFLNIAVVAREKRPAFFQARVKKQLSRVFALLCGASDSQYRLSLTRGIVDEADLDQNVDPRLPMDVIQRFQSYMEPLGVTQEVKVQYKKACQEGWAPAPTNDAQKAIWNEMHEVPTQPMVIKPEKHPAK